MNELLQNIRHALRAAGRETGYEKRVHLEVAGDFMRQYQALVEDDLGISTSRCCYCSSPECSH